LAFAQAGGGRTPRGCEGCEGSEGSEGGKKGGDSGEPDRSELAARMERSLRRHAVRPRSSPRELLVWLQEVVEGWRGSTVAAVHAVDSRQSALTAACLRTAALAERGRRQDRDIAQARVRIEGLEQRLDEQTVELAKELGVYGHVPLEQVLRVRVGVGLGLVCAPRARSRCRPLL
jgi:hypothetical protein